MRRVSDLAVDELVLSIAVAVEATLGVGSVEVADVLGDTAVDEVRGEVDANALCKSRLGAAAPDTFF